MMFDGQVQVLTYDKSTGSVFRNEKIGLSHGKVKPDTETKTSISSSKKQEKCTKRCARRSSNRKLTRK